MKFSKQKNDDRFGIKYYFVGPRESSLTSYKKLAFICTSFRKSASLRTLFANDRFIGLKLNYS